MKIVRQLTAILLGAASMSSTATACAVCMGDPNPNIIAASNSVLCVLLGLVGFIFASTGVTAFYLWRQARGMVAP